MVRILKRISVRILLVASLLTFFLFLRSARRNLYDLPSSKAFSPSMDYPMPGERNIFFVETSCAYVDSSIPNLTSVGAGAAGARRVRAGGGGARAPGAPRLLRAHVPARPGGAAGRRGGRGGARRVRAAQRLPVARALPGALLRVAAAGAGAPQRLGRGRRRSTPARRARQPHAALPVASAVRRHVPRRRRARAQAVRGAAGLRVRGGFGGRVGGGARLLVGGARARAGRRLRQRDPARCGRRLDRQRRRRRRRHARAHAALRGRQRERGGRGCGRAAVRGRAGAAGVRLLPGGRGAVARAVRGGGGRGRGRARAAPQRRRAPVGRAQRPRAHPHGFPPARGQVGARPLPRRRPRRRRQPLARRGHAPYRGLSLGLAT